MTEFDISRFPQFEKALQEVKSNDTHPMIDVQDVLAPVSKAAELIESLTDFDDTTKDRMMCAALAYFTPDSMFDENNFNDETKKMVSSIFGWMTGLDQTTLPANCTDTMAICQMINAETSVDILRNADSHAKRANIADITVKGIESMNEYFHDVQSPRLQNELQLRLMNVMILCEPYYTDPDDEEGFEPATRPLPPLHLRNQEQEAADALDPTLAAKYPALIDTMKVIPRSGALMMEETPASIIAMAALHVKLIDQYLDDSNPSKENIMNASILDKIHPAAAITHGLQLVGNYPEEVQKMLEELAIARFSQAKASPELAILRMTENITGCNDLIGMYGTPDALPKEELSRFVRGMRESQRDIEALVPKDLLDASNAAFQQLADTYGFPLEENTVSPIIKRRPSGAKPD